MLDQIRQAPPEDPEDIFKAVLARYGALYPNWEIIPVSIDRTADKNTQLDLMIALLEHLKES